MYWLRGLYIHLILQSQIEMNLNKQTMPNSNTYALQSISQIPLGEEIRNTSQTAINVLKDRLHILQDLAPTKVQNKVFPTCNKFVSDVEGFLISLSSENQQETLFFSDLVIAATRPWEAWDTLNGKLFSFQKNPH